MALKLIQSSSGIPIFNVFEISIFRILLCVKDKKEVSKKVMWISVLLLFFNSRTYSDLSFHRVAMYINL